MKHNNERFIFMAEVNLSQSEKRFFLVSQVVRYLQFVEGVSLLQVARVAIRRVGSFVLLVESSRVSSVKIFHAGMFIGEDEVFLRC